MSFESSVIPLDEQAEGSDPRVLPAPGEFRRGQPGHSAESGKAQIKSRVAETYIMERNLERILNP